MILIDMEMPKGCNECPLQDCRAACSCKAISEYMNTATYMDSRPEWCPLHGIDSEHKSALERMGEIFDDFIKHYGVLPGSVTVTEHVLQEMENEVRKLFIPPVSFITPRYRGVCIKTVNDNEVVLSMSEGKTIKYSLKEVEQQ